MKKEEAIQKINDSEFVDFEVFGQEEHNTYLENFKKTEVDSEMAKKVSSLHQANDDVLFDILGVRRESNEKTNEFIKRKFTDMQELSKSAEPLNAKIKELEQAIKDNSGDERLKQELQTVRDEYQKAKNEWDSEKTTHSEALNTYKLGNELDKAMIGFEFKKDIPQTVTDTFIAQVKLELQKAAKIVDGVMIFTDSEGKTLVNKDNALSPFTAKELLTQKLEGILSKAQKVDGVIKPKKEVVNGKTVTSLPNPGAKSKVEVTNYLKENGIPQGSADYNRMFAEFGEGLPIQ